MTRESRSFATIDGYLRSLSTREKVGQVIMAEPYTDPEDEPGAHADGGGSDDALAETDRRAIADLHVGTVGGPDVGKHRSPRDVAAYLERLQRAAASTDHGIGLLVNADFEYGAGQKVDGATEFPQAMGLGAAGTQSDAEAAARVTAREARSMGITWNNAPVADVNTNPDNPVIGWRSFGDDPDAVGDLVAAQVRGYQSESVAATPGHFPGHGPTDLDSHADLPVVDCSRAELEATHLAPFRRAVDAGAGAVMTGHLRVPCLDAERPATLSPAVHEFLRDRLDFDGVVVTDSLRMDAVAEDWAVEEAALAAIRAGADVAMTLCPFEKLVDVSDRLVAAVETGELPEARLNEAVRRVLRLKASVGLLDCASESTPATSTRPTRPPVEPVPESAAETCERSEHRARANDVAARSITLAANDGAVPFSESSTASVLVAGFRADSIADAVEARVPDACPVVRAGTDPTALPDADRIVVGSDGHRGLVERATERDAPVVAVESGTPYAAATYRGAPDAVVFAYDTAFPWAEGDNDRVRAAAVDVLFGRDPRGRLPVRVDDAWPRGHGITSPGDG